MQKETFLNQFLKKQEEKKLVRNLKLTSNLIDFTSNDYLGFARDSKLIQAVSEELKGTNYLGSTGSRLLTGNSELYEYAEKYIAAFHKHENATIFNCGYMANLGLLSAIASKQDIILYDIYIHASTKDGIRLSSATSYPFKHNDLNHLESRLSQNANHKGNIFVCIESVYGMHGSIAPLVEISHLCQQYNAYLIVDEAHAIGILGNQGEGLVSALGLQEEIFATVYTYGKALGIHGASIAGSHILKKYLINACKPFIYTTALPSYSIHAIIHSYKKNKCATQERQSLLSNIQLFKKCILNKFLSISNDSLPIQPILIANNLRAKLISKLLYDKGFDIRPIVSPTVQQGQEILRFCLHTFNTYDDIINVTNLINTFEEQLVCPLS